MSNEFVSAYALGRQNDLQNIDAMAQEAFGFPMSGQPPAGPQFNGMNAQGMEGPVIANQPAPQPIPPGGGSATPYNAGGRGGSGAVPPGLAGQLFQEFVSAGLPPTAAYGILGNIQQESGFNPNALNEKEGAFGLFQHRLDRRTGLESFAGGLGGKASDPIVQAKYAIHELKNQFPGVYKKLQAAQTPEEAAAIFDREFEKSAGAHTAQRQRFARAFAGGDFQAFGGEGGVTMSSRDSGGVLSPMQQAMIDKSPLVSPQGGDEEEEPDMSIEAQRRDYYSALGQGFFKGLGDIGKGKTADISPFLEAHRARQAEMRERLKEIRDARATREGREALLGSIATEHPDLLELAASGEEGLKMAQQTMMARTGQQITQENMEFEDAINDDNRTQQHQMLSDTIRSSFGDAPWAERAATAAIGSPELASTIISNGMKADQQAAEQARTDEANNALADFYRGQGFEDAAQHAENGDAVGARDIYKAKTGMSSDAQTWEYAQQLPASERADFWMKQGVKAGIANPGEQAALEVKTTQLKEQGKAFNNNATVMGRLNAAMELMKDPQFQTGPVTASTLPIFNALSEFGWNPVKEGTDAATAFKSMMEGTISYMRQPGEGSMSEGDAERLRSAMPSLNNSKEANEIIGYANKVIMERAEAAFNAKLQYLGENGVKNPKGEEAFVKDFLKEYNTAHGYSEDSIFHTVTSDEQLDNLNVPDGTPVFVKDGDTEVLLIKGTHF